MAKKLKLNDLKVQSFVTSLTYSEKDKLKGGGNTMICTEGHQTLCETFCDVSEYIECIGDPDETYYCSRLGCATDVVPECPDEIPE